jgi:hypothetical protein
MKAEVVLKEGVGENGAKTQDVREYSHAWPRAKL